jgi:hypothetical protein
MLLPRRIDFRRTSLLAAALGVLCLGLAEVLRAATFPDLYTVTVVVADAAERRMDVESLGMAQLLTRITGRRDAASAAELAHLVENAGDYVTSRGRLDRERETIGFTTEIVNELERANWPVWGAERPSTLLWIAVDFGDGQRALMGASPVAAEWSPELAEFMLQLREELDAVASERGLPITFPLLDLEDRTAISFAEVWGGFDGLIAAASTRYGADALLVGRVAKSSFGLDVRWNLLEDGRSSAVLGGDVRGGLDWLADQYAGQYGTLGGARIARIAVLDVTSLDTYARVMSHLESLSVLQSVDVEGFDGSTLNLRVAAPGDDRVVERVLTLGGVLVPSSGLAQVPAPIDGLVFRVAGASAGQ